MNVICKIVYKKFYSIHFSFLFFILNTTKLFKSIFPVSVVDLLMVFSSIQPQKYFFCLKVLITVFLRLY